MSLDHDFFSVLPEASTAPWCNDPRAAEYIVHLTSLGTEELGTFSTISPPSALPLITFLLYPFF